MAASRPSTLIIRPVADLSDQEKKAYYTETYEFWQRKLDLDNNNLEALRTTSLMLKKLGRETEAREALKLFLEAQKIRQRAEKLGAAANIEIGTPETRAQKFEKAYIEELTIYLKQIGKEKEFSKQLSQAAKYAFNGENNRNNCNPKAALTHYTSALELLPYDTISRQGRIEVHLNTKQYQKVIEDLDYLINQPNLDYDIVRHAWMKKGVLRGSTKSDEGLKCFIQGMLYDADSIFTKAPIYNSILGIIQSQEKSKLPADGKQEKTDYYQLGRAQLRKGHYEKAINCFSHVLAQQPEHHAALLDMGLAFLKLQDYAKAFEYYTVAIWIFVGNGASTDFHRKQEYYHRLSKLYLICGKILECETEFIKVMIAIQVFNESLPSSAQTSLFDYKNEFADDLVEKGIEYLGEQNLQNALLCFNMAIHYCPAHLNAHLERALVHRLNKDTPQALADYDFVLSKSPSHARARNARHQLQPISTPPKKEAATTKTKVEQKQPQRSTRPGRLPQAISVPAEAPTPALKTAAELQQENIKIEQEKARKNNKQRRKQEQAQKKAKERQERNLRLAERNASSPSKETKEVLETITETPSTIPETTLVKKEEAPAHKIPLLPEEHEILSRLEKLGAIAFTSGGSVRKRLSHQPYHDIDITTSASPDVLLKEPADFEIFATKKEGLFRVYTASRKPIDIFSSNLLREAQGKELDEKLFRLDRANRDFTINALRAHAVKSSTPADGYYAEVFASNESDLNDLMKYEYLKTTVPSQKSFRIDPKRMIRALYTEITSGKKISDEMKAFISNNANLLIDVPKEISDDSNKRNIWFLGINDAFSRLCKVSPDISRFLDTLAAYRFIEVLFPEMHAAGPAALTWCKANLAKIHIEQPPITLGHVYAHFIICAVIHQNKDMQSIISQNRLFKQYQERNSHTLSSLLTQALNSWQSSFAISLAHIAYMIDQTNQYYYGYYHLQQTQQPLSANMQPPALASSDAPRYFSASGPQLFTPANLPSQPATTGAQYQIPKLQ